LLRISTVAAFSGAEALVNWMVLLLGKFSW
jgi:hypothetical protein